MHQFKKAITMKTSIAFILLIIVGFLNCNNSNENTKGTLKTPLNPSVPYVIIQSEGEIKDEPKRKATMSIRQNNQTIFKSDICIEIRGAISQMYDKKSYGFELRDKDDKDTSLAILGMPKGSTWVLHGPFGDKTLLRNSVAYKISNNIGKYAARTAFIELEINKEYLGMYVLMEKLKRDDDRINITKLTEKDESDEQITGGYILKLDKTIGSSRDADDYNESNSFRSKFNEKGKASTHSKSNFLYDYPKAYKITTNQKKYIQNYINQFENALISADFKDAEKGYQKYIDVDSFIDYFILIELFQNHDGYRLSTYLQKDRGKKLQMGPIWDLDIAFGSDMGFCGEMNDHAWVFEYNKYCGGDPWLVPFWWKRLMQDEAFKTKLQSRWKTLRDSQLADNQLDKVIDDYTKYLTENGIVARNFEKWTILNHRITPNSTKGSHEKEISRMKSWLKEHARWIDDRIMTL
jgi:hypothetical protein